MAAKVLWIDDLKSLGDRHKDCFRSANMDLTYVTSPHDFKSLLEEKKLNFKAIIVDVKMKEFNPLEYLRDNYKELKNIPIFVVSAFSDEPDVYECIELLYENYSSVHQIDKPLPPIKSLAYKRCFIDFIITEITKEKNSDTYNNYDYIVELHKNKNKYNNNIEDINLNDITYSIYSMLDKSIRTKIRGALAKKLFDTVQDNIVERDAGWAIVLNNGEIVKFGSTVALIPSQTELSRIAERYDLIPLVCIRSDDFDPFEEFTDGISCNNTNGNDYYPTINFRIITQNEEQVQVESHFDTGSECTYFDSTVLLDSHVIEEDYFPKIKKMRGILIEFAEKDIDIVVTDGFGDHPSKIKAQIVDNWELIPFFKRNKFGNRSSITGRNVLSDGEGLNLVIRGKDKTTYLCNNECGKVRND